jgi:hypothetical protein
MMSINGLPITSIPDIIYIIYFIFISHFTPIILIISYKKGYITILIFTEAFFYDLHYRAEPFEMMAVL